jgi:osmoprotectant transport system substrate-binding protein
MCEETVVGRNKWFKNVAAIAVAGVLLGAAGCAASDDGDAIVIGSQGYYSNEIIAEIYAQALEHEGITVDRQFQLGQRDVYMPALEAGEIDLFPEYTGNLLQYFDPQATVTETDAVYDELTQVLPESLLALAMSPATDQDSYNVTAGFAAENNLVSIEDLVGIPGLILGGAPELAERPYGPNGLQQVYGVTVEFDATGETTVDALAEGLINMANVYSADPRIAELSLVTLEDPKGLFLASNVVPIVNSERADEVRSIIDAVSVAMTPAALVAMNVKSVDEKQSAAVIAKAWLTENGFLN